MQCIPTNVLFRNAGMTGSYILYCLVVIFICVVAYVVFAYNRLVLLRQRLQAAFSQIDVQLKRRHDLIPNLVNTVKLAMRHERETLEALAKARAKAYRALDTNCTPSNGEAVRTVSGAERLLSQHLSSVLGLVEKYPELKTSLNTSELMEDFRSTENTIAFARQHYNDTVARYNTYLESFPINMIAASFGFYRAELLEFEGSAFRTPAAVDF